MLRFLSSFWLISLLAVAVPVAIHLLSRKAGRKIKVGSIRFLEASESHRLKSLKLSEIPLLLLRAALVAMLALLMAQPQWLTKPNETATKPRGWVLVAPELLVNLPRAHQHLIDSLVAAGNELHLFAPGFPRGMNPTAQNWKPPEGGFSRLTSLSPMVHHRAIWSLLREVDTRLPAHAPLWIFSFDRLSSIRGERPALHATVNWHAVPSVRQNRWIHEARLPFNDSLYLVIGFSNARQTAFERYLLKMPHQQTILSNPSLPALEIIPHHGNRAYTLRLVEQDDNPADNAYEILSSKDSTIIAIIHDNQRRDDARYVQSALAAAAEFGKISLAIKSQLVRGDEQDIKNAGCVFWLAEQPVPSAVLEQVERGLRLISDAGAQPYERRESWIVMNDGNLENSPRLWRRVAPSEQGLILWTDGFGKPLLECQRRGSGFHFRFYSRFHSTWNELVLNPIFPEWALSFLNDGALIAPNAGLANHYFDQRRISAAQLLPSRQAAATAPMPNQISHDLYLPFWILAVLLFALERWIAERKTS
ncbi:BatA domain-containing protein [candidate division KSB1 bacterium]|nr:BatA domain-containing protein [candidate division KSB1 bacterium]